MHPALAQCSIAVIGLGYVGLPLAVEFGKKRKVIGFDIHEERVKMMQNHIDPSHEMQSKDFRATQFAFQNDLIQDFINRWDIADSKGLKAIMQIHTFNYLWKLQWMTF